MSADESIPPGHVKYVDIDWYTNSEGYQIMRSWGTTTCHCASPWRHYP